MPKLTRAQCIYVATLATLMLVWLGLLAAAPLLEYFRGPSKESALLVQLGGIAQIAVIALILFLVILQRIGVLPTVKTPAAYQTTMPLRLRNLAIWIVIALVLVFLFNLAQGSGPGKHPGPLLDGLINFVPMALLIGVWIFVMGRMRANKKPEGDGKDGV